MSGAWSAALAPFADRILVGDARARLKELPDKSVHCVITSPPYWGLRDYKLEPQVWGGDPTCAHEWGDVLNSGAFCRLCGAWRGQLGLEPTIDLYISHIVLVFREVRRVLRDDGTLWLNMGDCYCNSDKNGYCNNRTKNPNSIQASNLGANFLGQPNRMPQDGLKPKDLVGLPWRVAFALQAEGWWIRSDIIWAKPSPMPESVTDRPTRAHEYVFLLSKSSHYFYDQEAVSEPAAEDLHGRRQNASSDAVAAVFPRLRRNRRTIWTIPAELYEGAHYATFPQALVEPCIMAGTSEMGCCSACGTPVRRIVERSGGTIGESWHDHQDNLVVGRRGGDKAANGYRTDYCRRTVGWEPGCRCGAPAEPCLVLDPFMGSGTTALVALRLGRRFVGVELNPQYAAMAEERIRPEKAQLKIFF